MITQGDIWWAELGEPVGSAAGFRRPVLVVQSDAFNRSAIDTVVCVPLTGNMRLARADGNISLEPKRTGLRRESVANVSAILTIDKASLVEHVSTLDRPALDSVLAGIDIVLGR